MFSGEMGDWGLLEAGGRADPMQGVGPLRPHLSAWGFPFCWLSRSHRLAGDSRLTLLTLVQEGVGGVWNGALVCSCV